MFTKKLSVALMVVMYYTTLTEAVAILRPSSQLRCQCINLEYNQIPTKKMDHVELIPSGPHCKNVELIVTLNTGELVCVNPSAPWVQRLMKKILQSQENETTV